MHALREEHRVGLDYLAAVTALLQRSRNAHPTHGLYEAADFQWWWRRPRATDRLPQLFWFDDAGRPEAAMIATEWNEFVALDPLVMPGAEADWTAHVVDRGLVHAGVIGLETVDVMIDREDAVTRELLAARGFQPGDEARADVESWLAAVARPEVSPLAEGYRLASRQDMMDRPHHMIGRGGPDVEERLRQTSLYRPDLDLLVLDRRDRVAAYGLFWFDPVSSTGLVEPMRTEDEHQRRGLARHVLTSGIERLAAAGAERIKIVFDPEYEASRDLYLSVGFEPVRQTVVMSGRTGAVDRSS